MKIIFYVEVLIILWAKCAEIVKCLESTGSCKYAADRTLKIVGTRVTEFDTFIRWLDNRARDEEYTVWQSTDGEPTAFASFGETSLFTYDTIKLQMPYKIFGHNKTSDKYDEVEFEYSEMHCFRFNYRYLSDLLSSAVGKEYDPDSKPPLSILHYTKGVEIASRPILSLKMFIVLIVYSVFYPNRY